MDPKLLTQDGWKALALKFKVKDNGLQRALAAYENVPEDKHAERLKAVTSVNVFAVNLKKNEVVADMPAVANYLEDVARAAESEKSEIIKAGIAQKKVDDQAKKQQEQEEDYVTRLMTAFQKLKSAKELSYEFIVCDAKPHCGLMVAKRITHQHKEELTRMTGGSKRFLHLGACHFQDGHFAFTTEKPEMGLARKLQDSIKFFTGKKLPIVVDTESVEDDDE